MEDKDIVALYFRRDEEALRASEDKYGRYLYTVAYNILGDAEDSKECVNEGYYRAWNAIPPQKPAILRAFLAGIVRNAALNRYSAARAKKRTGEIDGIFEELIYCKHDGALPVDEEVALKNAVNGFLAALPKKKRIVFMQRYWYFLPVRQIAEKNGMSESAVKVTLMRTRERLKEHLIKEGFVL
ncbi:MAG: sigma-70 family RNA polymerase sigma factor [Clostridia bacterium]|nr:sigma-70 family RNA polymerase sigma factor [Clostridia bacterium]